MGNEQINELLCNIQIIKDKATETINFLLDKQKLDFEQVKDVYGKLEIVCGKTISSQVFIEMSVTDTCSECGEKKISINWDTGMLECQNSKCGHQWLIKPHRKLT